MEILAWVWVSSIVLGCGMMISHRLEYPAVDEENLKKKLVLVAKSIGSGELPRMVILALVGVQLHLILVALILSLLSRGLWPLRIDHTRDEHVKILRIRILIDVALFLPFFTLSLSTRFGL